MTTLTRREAQFLLELLDSYGYTTPEDCALARSLRARIAQVAATAPLVEGQA